MHCTAAAGSIMARIILHVVALLLLLLLLLQEGAAAAADGNKVVLHPLVVLPGFSCSDLEARLTDTYRPSLPRCGAMKGKGWFGLWANFSSLPADYAPCFAEQMTLVYDPAANDYRNLAGVETRVRGFGSTHGFHTIPDHPDWCFGALRRKLETEAGYVDGATLFGAPYDFRYAPSVPGQPSAFFSGYFRRLTRLVEEASRKNGDRKVILFGHSQGGATALEFVRGTSMAWRRRYIKHLILAAPLPLAEGIVAGFQGIAGGNSLLFIPNVTNLELTLRPMWRSFEIAISNFPSPAVYGHRPLVVTPRRNYSAYDAEDLLAAVGFPAGIEPFRRRGLLKKTSYFEPLMVPTTCFNALGNKTPEQLIYRVDGDFDAAPEVVYGDGDNTINVISMLAFDDKMRRKNKQYKSIKIQGVDHSTLLIDDRAVKQVLQEIGEANRI